MEHLTAAQIERIVMGLERPSGPESSHLRQCAQCAEALRVEAEHELALHQALAATTAPARAPMSITHGRAAIGVTWAAAAAAVLWAAAAMLQGHGPRALQGAPAEVRYGAMAPESLALAPGFRERFDPEPGDGTAPLSLAGREVFVEPGELVMIQ